MPYSVFITDLSVIFTCYVNMYYLGLVIVSSIIIYSMSSIIVCPYFRVSTFGEFTVYCLSIPVTRNLIGEPLCV